MKTNMIPDAIDIGVDIRTLPGEDGDDVAAPTSGRARRPRRRRRGRDHHERPGDRSAAPTPRCGTRCSGASAAVPDGAADAAARWSASPTPASSGGWGPSPTAPGCSARTWSRRLRVAVPRQRRAHRRRVARPDHPVLARRLCLSLLVIGIDNTILNVALPTLVRDLDATPASCSGSSTATRSCSPGCCSPPAASATASGARALSRRPRHLRLGSDRSGAGRPRPSC